MKLIIYIDGACRFNPGPAGVGVWILNERGETLGEVSKPLGHGTNNVAEWQAYLCALEQARRLKASELTIFSDSRLLVEQVRGTFKVRHPNLIRLWRKAKEWEQGFKRVDVKLIPREQNTKADALAKKSVQSWFLASRNPNSVLEDYDSNAAIL